MKKTIILSIALLVISGGVAFAQNSKSFYKTSYESRNSGSWDQESSILSFGLGFPNTAVDYSGLSGFPPIYAKYEHGFLRDEVGLGGYVSTGFGSVNNNYSGTNHKNNFFAFSIGVLGYYHFNKLIPIEKMDVYAGAGLAFRSVSYSGDDSQYTYGNDSKPRFITNVGIRYYVKPKLALYGEISFDGMSTVNLGVTFKLK